MKKLIMGLALAANISVFAQPTIEIGLLLDSSGSMGGLINKTRNTLWEVLNILDDTHKNGEIPKVSLGIYSYGNGVSPDAQDEIVMISNLTTDHDSLSLKFFELGATGSLELAGKTISKSVKEFNWTEEGDFKALFLAGNETLKQGEVSVESASELTLDNDIFLNTIYANDSYISGPSKIPSFGASTRAPLRKIPVGNSSRGQFNQEDIIKEEWNNLAVLSGGSFAHISNNEVLAHIDTPYDSKLLELDQELNKTFVYFGKFGHSSYQQMINLDSQIGNSSSSAMVSRGRYKVGHGYSVKKWDLVEAYFEGSINISDVDKKTLQKDLQGLNDIDLIMYLTKMKKLRKDIKDETKELYKKHKEYVDKKRLEMGKKTIEMVMIDSLKAQLSEKGFDFK